MQLNDITSILEVIVLVIIAPLLPLVVAKAKQWVDANVSERRLVIIQEAARIGVLATEQMGLNGEEAKENAIKLAQAVLATYGLTVDLERLVAMIEATVMSELNSGPSLIGAEFNRA